MTSIEAINQACAKAEIDDLSSSYTELKSTK